MVGNKMISIKNNSIKAAAWYTICNFLSKGILYILTPLYTRMLKVGEYGDYNNFVTWQSLLGVAITLDLHSTVSNAYIDYTEKEEFEKYISTIMITSLVFPLMIGLLVFIKIDNFAMFFHMQPEYVVLLIVSTAFSSALNILQAEQRSKNKYKMSCFLTILTSVGTAILSLILISCLENRLKAIIWGSTILNIIVNIYIYIYCLKRKVYFGYNYLKYAFVLALPLIPHLLAANIMGSSDKLMITQMCGSEKNALYSLVYNCAMVVTLLTTSLNQAWVPWFYRQVEDDNKHIIKKVSKFYCIGYTCIVSIFCFVAPEVVLIMGGESYREAAYLVPVIMFGCVCRFFYTLYVNVEFFLKKTWYISIATIGASVINVILNYIGITWWGYIAAAYATLVANICMLVFHVFCVHKMKKLDIFDNKFNLLIFLFSMIFCLGMMILYPYTILRYSILVLGVIIGGVVGVKHRGKVKQVLRGVIN